MNETLSTFRYNWYETNLCKFLEKYALPVKYEGDVIQFLKKYRDDFLKDFDELLQRGPIKGYVDNGEMIYSQIEQQFEYIESCFSIIVYYKILNLVPCAILQALVVYLCYIQ